MRSLIIISALALSAALSPATAADLNLLCKTEFTKPDGSQVDYLRQYEITFSTHNVVAFDNQNGGWTKSFTTAYVSADNYRIVIAQADTVYHEINRVTGMAFSKMSNGELKRGICSPANALGM